jgi:hypothetical protein
VINSRRRPLSCRDGALQLGNVLRRKVGSASMAAITANGLPAWYGKDVT